MAAASGNEGGAEEDEERDGCQPEAGGVEEREGHAAGADLRGEDEVAEACLWGSGEDEEEHDGAVDGDEGEVVFGQDGAVERSGPVGQTRWTRMRSERRVPMTTEMSARRRYWMPMMRWSVKRRGVGGRDRG